MFDCHRQSHETDLHLSSDQISHHLTSTTIGHVSHVDTRHHLEQLAGDMGELPLPGDAIVTLPGLAFAKAMNSGTVLAGNDGCTTRNSGARRIPATGTMSRRNTKLSLS